MRLGDGGWEEVAGKLGTGRGPSILNIGDCWLDEQQVFLGQSMNPSIGSVASRHSHCLTGVSSWTSVLLPADQGGGGGERQHHQAHQGGQSRPHTHRLTWLEMLPENFTIVCKTYSATYRPIKLRVGGGEYKTTKLKSRWLTQTLSPISDSSRGPGPQNFIRRQILIFWISQPITRENGRWTTTTSSSPGQSDRDLIPIC